MKKSICTKCGSFDENCCGSSGQSASSGAAGCRPDADQGIRYAVIRYQGPIRFDDSVDVVAQDLDENPAVARVPATPALREQLESLAWKLGCVEGRFDIDTTIASDIQEQLFEIAKSLK